MTKDNNDLTIINFDHDWKCYHQISADNVDEEPMILVVNDIHPDHRWSSVELPHINDMNKQEKNKSMYLSKWWYWKQFDWASISQQYDQQIYLSFESSDSVNNNSYSSNNLCTIWLNNVQIFSDSLTNLNEQIELPTKLLRTNHMEKTKHDNTLVICCSDTSLFLHARLIFYGKLVCAIGQIQVNDKALVTQTNSERKEKDILDYIVSVDESSDRIKVVIKSNKKYKAPLRPTLLPTSSSESENNENQLDEHQEEEEEEESKDDMIVPRLAIVILIVGTRGDVQPFIA